LLSLSAYPSAGWRPFAVDLSAYAGQTILLSLVTDSDGANYYDWAFWGEPRLVRLDNAAPVPGIQP